jgi:hypothetical protein
MQSETQNDKKQQGRRGAYVPTREDAIGMLGAALEELAAAGVGFMASNARGAVILLIDGARRVDDESAGTWHLEAVTPAGSES